MNSQVVKNEFISYFMEMELFFIKLLKRLKKSVYLPSILEISYG
jgi:hypothetical protein